MKDPFELRSSAENPYRLSVGYIVSFDDTIALIKKDEDYYTLPRETMWSNESITETIIRGAKEELGKDITAVDRFLGSIIAEMDRPYGLMIKTTVYFFAHCSEATHHRELEQDEKRDKVLWVSPAEAIQLLKDQTIQEFKEPNKEYEIVARTFEIAL